MNLMGIQRIEPVIKGNVLKEIKFAVETFSMSPINHEIHTHEGSRKDKIAKFLIENKGIAFTALLHN